LHGERGIALAIEQDRALKIGWPNNEPAPRSGDLGFAPALPEGLRLRYLGEPASFAIAANNGANVNIEGGGGTWLGAWQRHGRIRIEGDSGKGLAHGATGGHIIVEGSVGDDAGTRLDGGMVLIRGNTGKRIGAGMSSGLILVQGDIGEDPGAMMTGGRIIVEGRAPVAGSGARSRPSKAADRKVAEKAFSDLGITVDKDAVVIEADGASLAVTQERRPATGDWSTIQLVSDQKEPLEGRRSLDLTRVMTSYDDATPPLGLRAALLLSEGDSSPGAPSLGIKRDQIRRLDAKTFAEHLCNPIATAGLLIDIDEMPDLDDQDLDGILAALLSVHEVSPPLLIIGGLARVDRLARIAERVLPTAILLNFEHSEGRTATSVLPISGRLGGRIRETSETPLGLCIPWEICADDLLIAAATGADFILGTTDIALEELTASARGRLLSLGIDSIEQLGRRNLRALDPTTAAVSGLRLIGYERPLPEWLA